MFTDEVSWHVMSSYPLVGKTAQVDFKGTIFEFYFKNNLTMSFEGTSGAFKGVKDTVEYTAIEISKNVFMVYWHEPSTASNIVHVQDWKIGTVFTNISATDNSFTHLKGTIKIK